MSSGVEAIFWGTMIGGVPFCILINLGPGTLFSLCWGLPRSLYKWATAPNRQEQALWKECTKFYACLLVPVAGLTLAFQHTHFSDYGNTLMKS
jgi:hypothetical protein